jgi:hypothetical protein
VADQTRNASTSAEPGYHLAVDAEGYCWRVFPDGTWSMARINPDNSPIPQPVTHFEPLDRLMRAREAAHLNGLERDEANDRLAQIARILNGSISAATLDAARKLARPARLEKVDE